ncbi:MAG: M20/M25/M40 family metallo-hydrolase [Candidatus Coatesbacteria bacterium]|nr:M20/M25/M40 family metallo-hydrolase [Candidatus Coatesbacteria bacterium]
MRFKSIIICPIALLLALMSQLSLGYPARVPPASGDEAMNPKVSILDGRSLGRLNASRSGNISDDFLNELVSQMNEEDLWELELAMVGFGSRYTFREENLAAADWLFEELSSYGLEAEFMEDCSFGGWPIRNVIGTLRGSVDPERVVVLSGHFDTIVFPAENNVYSDAPGADDNTTAVSTVLDCARILSQYEPTHTIKFAFYSGEEQNLLGSEYVIGRWLDEGTNVVANINLDCLGWSDDGSLKINTDVNLNSEWLLDYSSRAASFTSVLANANVGNATDEIWYGSDHAWFWHYGIPALFIGEGHNSSPYWHTLDDSLEHINKSLFLECAKLTLLTTSLVAFDEPAEPSLSVFVNIQDIQVSDNLHVDVSFVNPGAARSLAFCMAIITPQGDVSFYPDWSADFHGVGVNLPSQTWSERVPLCCFQVPCVNPPLMALGTYRIVAGFTDKEGELVGNMAEAFFSFSPMPRCPEGMVRVPAGSYTDYFGQSHFVQEFCIDRYEYPNVYGELPLEGIGWIEAWANCIEQGKFLCSKDQWVRACKGTNSYRFPYGDQYTAGLCNTEGEGTLPSGSCDQCRSEFGAYDMSGNVFEWTSSAQWQNAAFGGWYKSRGFMASCEYAYYPYPAGPLGQTSKAGFRCCMR